MAKKPVGRPKIIFSDEQLRQMEVLAAMGASNESIADFMGCSADTLEHNFSGVLKKGKERMKNNLRLIQFKYAMKGNTTMMVWLGKNLLNQSDRYTESGGELDGFEFRNPKVA